MSRFQSGKAAVVFFSILVMVAFSVDQMAQADFTGRRLPSLEATTLEGEAVKIESVISDRVTVLVMTTTWCQDCKKLDSILRENVKSCPSPDIAYCCVYIGQKALAVKEALSKQKDKSSGFRTFLDEKRKIPKKLKLNSIPCLFIIDRDGTVLYAGLPPDAPTLCGLLKK